MLTSLLTKESLFTPAHQQYQAWDETNWTAAKGSQNSALVKQEQGPQRLILSA